MVRRGSEPPDPMRSTRKRTTTPAATAAARLLMREVILSGRRLDGRAALAIDGARLWLMRRSLQSAVDAAALAGAGEVDVDRLYATGGAPALDPRAAERRAVAVLRERGLGDRIEVVAVSDAVRASVRGHLDASFLALVGIARLPVAAEATAEPVAGER